MRAPALAGFLALVAFGTAAAQFQVAVPPQVDADTVIRAKYIVHLRATLDTMMGDSIPPTSLPAPTANSPAKRYCELRWDIVRTVDSLFSRIGISDLDHADVDRPAETLDRSEVIDTILAQAKTRQLPIFSCTDETQVFLEDGQLRIATKEGAIVSHRADGGFNRRHWVHTLPKSYERVASLYAAKGVGFLTDATAGISDDKAFLTTSIISGVVWRLHFSAGLMESQSITDSPDPAAITTEDYRDRQNAVQRLIFNGGSAAVRFLMPFGAEGGRYGQRSGGLYLQLGAVGDLTDTKDLRGTIGLVVEHMLALAVRKPSDHTVAAQFLFGARAGYHYVPEGTGILRGVRGNDNNAIPFGQLLFGLRQSDKLDYAVVYTISDNRYKPYLSAVQFRVKASSGND